MKIKLHFKGVTPQFIPYYYHHPDDKIKNFDFISAKIMGINLLDIFELWNFNANEYQFTINILGISVSFKYDMEVEL